MQNSFLHTPLRPGMTIGVMAPSSYIEQSDIEASARCLEARGYQVFIHPQSYERAGQSAGTTLQKALALQGLWMRGDIDAIWFAGGGNQSMALLNALNFDSMRKKPKPVLGFSDSTLLINTVQRECNVVTYHAPVFKMLHTLSDSDFDLCLTTLEASNYSLSFENTQILAGSASVEGTLYGGNLSLFQYLPSLMEDRCFDGAILFLEDCHEELSRCERMFAYLNAIGLFDQVSGVLLGQFSDMKDTGRPFGMAIESIFSHYFSEKKYPVITGLPFGHHGSFTPFPLGAKASINMENNNLAWK